MTVLITVILSSCEVDYDFEGKDLKRRVVVNALITPQEEFAVRLNWSGTYTDGTKFKAVADAEMRRQRLRHQIASRTPKSGCMRTTQRSSTARLTEKE